jgi:hypothetical protein
VTELPKSVRIREVGPRDGFQNEPETIDTAEKVRLIDLLSATGVGRMEITSFVRPDVIPQLADAAQVLMAVQRRPGVSFSVLIPNERGLWSCAIVSMRSVSSSPPRRPTTSAMSTARSRSRWSGWRRRWPAPARRDCAARA